jgi:putative transposon-encoded protein
MRTIQVKKGDLTLKDDVEVIYERVITQFGNSAKIDAQKKHIGKRAYVLVLKD